MIRILVVYDSLTGNVEKMAEMVAEGVRERGGEVDIVKVDEVDLDKIATYDGFALGSPTHCGTMSSKMNSFINNRLHKRYWGKLGGKVGVAFTSSGGLGGGNEITLMALLSVILNFGMITFGIPDYVSKDVTLHYGAVSIKTPDKDTIEACRLLGRRLVEYSMIVKQGLEYTGLGEKDITGFSK
ncbi:flavodoxin family protein [Candidatus Bathyarchaeota archaeon]|nr:flavodoxin family protein [Candidatus Bathyarchaeota archaeon]